MNYLINKEGKVNLKVLSFMILFASLILFVSSISWNGAQGNTYNGTESLFIYNLSLNVSYSVGESIDNISSFEIKPSVGKPLLWNGISRNLTDISSWIFLRESKNQSLIINSSTDNETGTFKLPIQINYGEDFVGTTFTFNISPINDKPIFSYVNSTYTFPATGLDLGSAEYNRTYNVTVYDEEIYEGTGNPINFTYNITSCTLAGWLTPPADCNNMLSGLSFDLMQNKNDTALFYYAYNESEVGNYTLNITIVDNSSCTNLINQYNNTACNSTYEISNYNSTIITLFVESALNISLVGCEGQTFLENESGAYCNITIRTRYPNDPINLSSTAYFANDLWETPSNPNWFYADSSNVSNDSFLLVVPILVNTSKKNVGNWTINFTVQDERFDSKTESFNISILKSSSDGPRISPITNQTFSTFKEDTIPFNIIDEDFLIEDTSVYNESINFTIEITNLSDAQVEDSSFFFNIEEGIHTTGNNYQNFSITFNTGDGSPNRSHVGNYSINLTFTDLENHLNWTVFNITINPNNYPSWNLSETYDFNITVNSTKVTTVENISVNLTNHHVFDSDVGDDINFTIQGDYPGNLAISNVTKMLELVPWKQDVGYWEFNVTAIDNAGLTNTSTWVINVSNTNSLPEIELTSFTSNDISKNNLYNTSEGNTTIILITVYDNDLFIDSGGSETLSIHNLTISNESGVPDPLSFSFSELTTEENYTIFRTSFIPRYENTNNTDTNYSIFIEVNDTAGELSNYTFNFTIFSLNNPPTINNLENQSTSILNESYEYQVNAMDYKDDYNNVPLTYEISNQTAGSPNLTINLSTGLISFNFSNNESYAGEWLYQVNVTDSDNESTLGNFTLFVYGSPNITVPINTVLFNLTENTTTQLNFTIDYPINNTNLTYNIYLDRIIYGSNNTTTYTNQSLVKNSTFIYLDSENVSISFTPNYSDETYGLEKNFTLKIFNVDFPSLQDNDTWKTNITHTNQNITFNYSNNISDQTNTTGNTIYIDLKDHFNDVDAFDSYYNQNINFTVRKSDGSRSDLADSATISSSWVFSIGSSTATTEEIKITAYEWNSTSLLNSVVSNNFNVTFIQGDSGTSNTNTGSSGGSSSTRREHYALKIITPDNIKISDENYILINFSLYNTGDVALSGIDLSSLIELSGIVSDDLKISFSDDYVESLAIGEMKNYSMRVDVNTGAVGKYDITIFGNVTSPKFSDWATFSIEVLAVDESKLSQLLIFTEKLVSENPECLELRESYSEAENLYNANRLVEANQLLNDIVTACQESISRNEQIKNNETKVKTTLIYTLITTISILLTGFIYYTIRKIRFNKSKNKEYI